MGTGIIYREFLYVDDAADAIIFLLENNPSFEIVNIGAGIDLTIKELVYDIKDIVDFESKLVFDKTKSDGIYKRQLDMSKL